MVNIVVPPVNANKFIQGCLAVVLGQHIHNRKTLFIKEADHIGIPYIVGVSLEEALKREETPSSIGEAKKMEGEIAKIKEELSVLRARWNQEKQKIQALKEKKNALETLRFKEEEAERAADYNKVAEIRYNGLPKLKKEIESYAHL